MDTALVGLTEAAEILKVKRSNLRGLKDMPKPLQDRGIEGFAVVATPLWVRAEIVALAKRRARARKAAARKAKRKRIASAA